MFNDWLTIGPVTIHGYGVMIAVGILAAFFLGEREAKRRGLNPNEVDNIIFSCLLCGFLCSKITFVLTNWNAFLKDPMRFLGPDGWVVYGGIIGGILGGWLWCRFRKLKFMDYANALFPMVALAQGFGRIGCFFAGCCYGKETSGLGVVFPEGSLAPSGVKLIPTQLLSAFGDFILFYILLRMSREESTRKYTMGAYLTLYSAGRFLIEFFRGDEGRGFIGPLSTSQFIALFMFAAGVILLLISRKEGPVQKKETV